MSGLDNQVWRHCKEQHWQIISWKQSIEAPLLPPKNTVTRVHLCILGSWCLKFCLFSHWRLDISVNPLLESGDCFLILSTFESRSHRGVYLNGRACNTYMTESWRSELGISALGIQIQRQKLSKHKRDVQKV